MNLRIGRIRYANCTPIFTALARYFDCSGYTFTDGVPALLNTMLSEGALDLCPSSSIEYARGYSNYCILPNLSISSIGPVKSVLLFSKVPIEQLDGCSIGLTAESATSVCLLKILLAVKFGFSNTFERTSEPLHQALQRNSALLLIGDAALQAAGMETGCHVYDLGELWYRFTGYPFVFALWIVRRESAEQLHDQVAGLSLKLQQAKQIAYETYGEIAESCAEAAWMSPAQLVAYWQTISYDLTEEHLAGVRCFFRLAAENGFLLQEPQISIFG